MSVEKLLGRRISDQSADRLSQIAVLAALRGNLRVILEHGPKGPSDDFRARQYYVALENSEKIVSLVIDSMNKGTR